MVTFIVFTEAHSQFSLHHLLSVLSDKGRTAPHLVAGEMPSQESKRQNARAALDPITTESPSGPSNGAGMSRMAFVSKALMAPFNHKKSDSSNILAEREWLPR